MTARPLVVRDEPLLRAFLTDHLDSSLLVLSNLLRAGMVDRGLPHQATYVGHFDEPNALVGVAALCWNGALLLQAPRLAARATETQLLAPWLDALRDAAQRRARPLTKIFGPWAQAQSLVEALRLTERATQVSRAEDLYALDLSQLREPPACNARARPARLDDPRERELLVQWRAAFVCEGMGGVDTPALRRGCATELELLAKDDGLWVLEGAYGPVATAARTARACDAIQIGGVWTPPEQRGRGYARCVVAEVLKAERARGAKRGVLFTHPHNRPAYTAYRALGFEVVGDYGMVVFSEPVALARG